MFFNLLEGETPQPGSSVGSIIIMVVLIVAIIGLFVWQSISGKKKQKEAQNMVNSLKIGDRVKTIGGICGFVAEISNADNTFVLETGTDANKSFIRFDKGAIYQTAPNQGNSNPAPVAEKEVAPKVEEKEEAEQPAPKKTTRKKKTEEEL